METKAFTLKQADSAMDASSRYTAKVAATAAEAIREVGNAKQDKVDPVTVVLSTTGWKTDSDEYPAYYDITDSSVTEADRADVTIIASEAVAKKCKFKPVTSTHAGYIRIRAKTAPAEVLSAEYNIWEGNG